MFSTNQLQYIDTLIPTYSKEGYKYYVVYTNTVVNSGYYGSSDPDTYAVFSMEKITAQDGYTYDISESSILVTIRSGNYSSSNGAVNTARVVVEEYNQGSAGILTVNEYEHIYTNAEWEAYALQPDYTLSSEGGNIIATQALGYISTILLLFILVGKLFRH